MKGNFLKQAALLLAVFSFISISATSAFAESGNRGNHDFSVLGNISSHGDQPVALNNRELAAIEGEGGVSALITLGNGIAAQYGTAATTAISTYIIALAGGTSQADYALVSNLNMTIGQFKNAILTGVPNATSTFIEVTYRAATRIRNLPTQ